MSDFTVQIDPRLIKWVELLEEVEAKARADERAAIMSRVKQDMTVEREEWTRLAQSVSVEQARIDERERIAQAIETLPNDWLAAVGAVVVRAEAARIARNGGSDE